MSSGALELLLDYSKQGCLLREKFFAEQSPRLVELARTVAIRLAKGGKVMFCGNGGSAADAQHLAAEYVNRFLLERPPLPALALSTDTSALTAIGNDYGFEQVFEKQVRALGQAGDVLVGISTSGSSQNVVAALKAARDKGIITACFAGAGGKVVPLSDFPITVPSEVTPLIQECHIAAGHMLCRLTDYFLFEAVLELKPYLED